MIVGVLVLVVAAYYIYQTSQVTDVPHNHGEEFSHSDMTADDMDLAMAAMTDLPEDHETLVQMGNQFMDDQNFPVAAEIYKRALEKKEVNDVRVDYGACLHGMGLALRAIEEFQTVLAKDPTHGIAIFNVGIVYNSQQQADSARAYFKKYLEMEPHGQAAASARAQLQELGG